MVHRMALTHHERWDGTGYPIGLVGNDIPVDAYFRILNQGCGTHCDPKVLHAFFRCRDAVVQLQMDFPGISRPT